MRLSQIAEGFFAWPDGPYAANRRAAGMRISEWQCRDKESAIKLRVLPVLSDMRLTEITAGTIRDLRNKLFEKGFSGGSINKTLFALRAVLEYAEEHSLIQAVPTFQLASDKQQRRGVLTPEEVRALFALPWPDRRCLVANLLAAGSGLRAGEVAGFQHQDVHDGYLEVLHSWSPSGLKTTKTDRERYVPIPDVVDREIRVVMKANPFGVSPEAFVFYGTRVDRPMDARLMTEALYESLKALGIDRRERRIDFHSWRHWYNAFLVNHRIPVHKVRSIVGHATDAMTTRYYHPDEYQDVRELLGKALPRGT